MNGVEHKCGNCGYETKYDYCDDYKRVQGDDDFVIIKSGISKSSFPSDINGGVFNDEDDTQRVILIGCPKCKVVSFQELY